jgi:hypothetical protein
VISNHVSSVELIGEFLLGWLLRVTNRGKTAPRVMIPRLNPQAQALAHSTLLPRPRPLPLTERSFGGGALPTAGATEFPARLPQALCTSLIAGASHRYGRLGARQLSTLYIEGRCAAYGAANIAPSRTRQDRSRHWSKRGLMTSEAERIWA